VGSGLQICSGEMCADACDRCRAGAKTAKAVPFIAADQPNERSEFSHADKAIVATTLAYYKQGLTQQQVVQLLVALEDLLPGTRHTLYR
jgi:Protein of unknown function (DUF3645)